MLVNYYNQHHNQNLVILSINDGDPQKDVAAFVRKYGMEFPVLVDPESTFMKSQMLDSLPTSILVGKDGKIMALHIGGMDDQIFQNEILAKMQ